MSVSTLKYFLSVFIDRAKRARNRELRAEGRTDAESENEGEDSTSGEEEIEESDRKLRTRQRNRAITAVV